jgi:hypothetical protein
MRQVEQLRARVGEQRRLDLAASQRDAADAIANQGGVCQPRDRAILSARETPTDDSGFRVAAAADRLSA